MKAFVTCFFLLMHITTTASEPGSPFDIASDSIKQSVLNYRTRNGLLIVPAIINDTIRVNLILDPHCRTLVLFGKRYEKVLQRSQKHFIHDDTKVDQNNLSSLTSHHKVEIGMATEKDIPILVMPNKNPLNFFTDVNGIIGYEILSQFEVMVDRRTQTMIIRPADKSLTRTFVRRNHATH